MNTTLRPCMIWVRLGMLHYLKNIHLGIYYNLTKQNTYRLQIAGTVAYGWIRCMRFRLGDSELLQKRLGYGKK